MGRVVSSMRDGFTVITQVVKEMLATGAMYNALLTRAASDPGLPVPQPTSSYWMRDPPHPELLDVQPPLPSEADVVIIGSGITSAAATRTIYEFCPGARVVLFEARQLCSGATARNGGHIKCTPHWEYAHLRKQFGRERAQKILRMELMNLGVLTRLGREFPDGEVREVETVDMFIDEGEFEEAKKEVDLLRGEMPEVPVDVWESREEIERFGVNELVVGAVSFAAGALWPFRLVTGVWERLVRSHENLVISTHTPVEAVGETDSTEYPYAVHTARGTVRARHVLHATNGHAGHLLPALRGSLTGVIGHMTAQRPGNHFPRRHGDMSWSVMYSPAFDYASQRPDAADGSQGDLMLGGALFKTQQQGLDQIGVWDDGRMYAGPLMHLRGSMATLFEPRWGAGSELKKAWTGILGFTGDLLPLVGALPQKGRECVGGLDGRGEWIAAGFCGEGMVWAWLSGTAVALMMLGKEGENLGESVGRPGGRLGEWYPVEETAVDAARLRRADLKNLMKWL